MFTFIESAFPQNLYSMNIHLVKLLLLKMLVPNCNVRNHLAVIRLPNIALFSFLLFNNHLLNVLTSTQVAVKLAKHFVMGMKNHFETAEV